METTETIKQIKRSFRLFMNGVASHSMREKGLIYKVNWGISQIELRHMASQYEKSIELGNALWNENSRECKILATLLMPSESMTLDVAERWTQDIGSVELAETVALNLFQYLEDADNLAQFMLRSENVVLRLCAYNLVCRLVRKNALSASCRLSAETAAVLFDVAATDLNTSNRQLIHALVNCLDSIAAHGGEYSSTATEILNEAGFCAF